MAISRVQSQGSGILNNRGFALVFVLWVFIFLFVVAFDFTGSVREEGMAAHRFAQETGGYFLALAGFEQGVYRLMLNRETGSRGAETEGSLQGEENPIVFGEWTEAALGEGTYRVCFVDEGGKINLKWVDEETLQRVFSNLGIEQDRIGVLVDSILDWRDEDDLHRLNGAEKDYYLALSPPYGAKDGPFDTVEELLWVKGMTRDLFYGYEEEGTRRVGLREIFTVDGRHRRVNLLTTSAAVCQALLGQSLEECEKFVQERKDLSEDTISDLLDLLGRGSGESAVRQFTRAKPSVVSIEAVGYLGGSKLRRRLRGVVRLLGGSQGFSMIRWVDWSGENYHCEES